MVIDQKWHPQAQTLSREFAELLVSLVFSFLRLARLRYLLELSQEVGLCF